jgi:hypothetical protein
VLALLPSETAQAGMITIYDSTLGAWTVSWNDSRVDVTDITPGQNADNPIQTTMLQKFADFSAVGGQAPIVLTFTENDVSNANVGGSAGLGGSGLNFRLFNIIFNNTGVDWSGFRELLSDQDQILEAGDLSPAPPPTFTQSTAHPAIAHFHNRPNTATDFNITLSPPWSLATNIEPKNDLFLTQPPNVLNGNGGELNFDVRIHDILAQSYKRSFTLTESPSPVPEPAGLTLFGLGMIGLAACAWRRRTGASGSKPAACR